MEKTRLGRTARAFLKIDVLPEPLGADITMSLGFRNSIKCGFQATIGAGYHSKKSFQVFRLESYAREF
jgi:hypothetical protein